MLVAIAGVATTAWVAASRGSEPGPWLTALQQEPLATMIPPGGRLVLDVAIDEHQGWLGPSSAEISRVFAFPSRSRATHGRDAVIEAATSSGWHVNPRRTRPFDLFYGSKSVSLGGATLTIGNYESDGVFKVSVRLEQGACGREFCHT